MVQRDDSHTWGCEPCSTIRGVAQWYARLGLAQEVVGSNPATPTEAFAALQDPLVAANGQNRE